MCGVTGFILKKVKKNFDFQKKIIEMTKTLSHRGPDGMGVWISQNDGLFLGHRRLSIFDLSPNGDQPMHSLCGRYVISFNGEIYNFKILRSELEAKFKKKFLNNTDTQVLLELVSVFGLENALKKIEGMFAFVIWDKKLKNLTLARDRYGEKPLFYYNDEEKLIIKERKTR